MDDLIGNPDGCLSVRYQHHGLASCFLPEGSEDDSLAQAVQIAGRLIQEHERRVMEEGPCQTDPLALTAGEGFAQFSHLGIISLGQGHDKIMNSGFFAGLYHLLVRGVQTSDPDIGRNSILEKLGLLGHIALHIPEIRRIDLLHIPAGDGHAAFSHTPETHEKLEQGGFAAAALSNDAYDLFFRQVKGKI